MRCFVSLVSRHVSHPATKCCGRAVCGSLVLELLPRLKDAGLFHAVLLRTHLFNHWSKMFPMICVVPRRHLGIGCGSCNRKTTINHPPWQNTSWLWIRIYPLSAYLWQSSFTPCPCAGRMECNSESCCRLRAAPLQEFRRYTQVVLPWHASCLLPIQRFGDSGDLQWL